MSMHILGRESVRDKAHTQRMTCVKIYMFTETKPT